MKSRPNLSERFRCWSAGLMLVSGVALSAVGFVVPPVGEISDSVLWYVAQSLIYAGSVFGVDVVIDRRIQRNAEKDSENSA